VNRTHVLVAGAVICAVACAGCGSSAGTAGSGKSPATMDATGAGAGAGAGRAPTGAAAGGGRSGAPWVERGVLAEDAGELEDSQVLDQGTEMLYELVPVTKGYILRATDLRTGRVRRGALLPVLSLALASGYLWAYGSPSGRGDLVLDEVSLGTLGVIRSVSVPVPGFVNATAVTAGAAGSVWAGGSGVLVRISARTGAVLGRVTVPSGLLLTGLAAGPTYLYAAAQRVRPGGAVVLEYSAGAGRLVAQSGAGALKWALAGASLTAVPGGVWVWFRTGMLGASVLLRAGSLVPHSEPPVSAADSPTTGVGTIYDWAMASSAVYGGGVLWVVTDGGLVACVNPATGKVRAEETIQGLAGMLLAADRREVVAAVSVTGYAGIVAISPPRTCSGAP
jgi:hypothetical protein